MTKYNNSTSHRGHNARTPGAAGNGLREHEVAQTIHEKFIKVTKAVDCTDDAGTTANANLVNIVAKMNRVGISFHVSHHLNAFNGQANGFEVWYFAGNEDARKLAQAICDEVCKATGWVNRGAKATTSFYVIRASVGTAVLIEWGFIDSKRDMDILNGKMDDAVNAALKAMGYSTSSGGSSNGGGSTVAIPQPTPTYTVEPWNKRQVVSTDVLNVRAAQNTNSRVIKQLKRGQTFNATRITRNGESVNGFTTWFEVDGEGWVSGALVTEVSNNNTAAATPPANVWHSRSGTVTVTAAKGINLRGTSSGDTTNPTGLGILALLGRGQQVKYDRLLVQRNGHAFVRQPRVDGYGWLAIGPTKNGKVIGYWTSGISI